VSRWKDGFLGGKWKTTRIALFDDSTLAWFDHNSDTRPNGSLYLKSLVPYMAIGQMTGRIPGRCG
jgi:hypothetical protein